MSQSTAVTDELKRALQAEEGGRRWLRRIAVTGSAALIVAAGVAWRVTHRPPPAAKYVTAEITTGDVSEKVQATGAVQPVLQINVGAQVNGRVTRVLVDFNSTVHKGDVLAEIDPAVYNAQVNQGEAQVVSQRAQMDSARATMDTTKVQYERTRRLFDQNLASKGDLDTAKGNYDVAAANVASAEAQIVSMRAQLTQSVANVGYTKIYSPVDGVVVTRSIDPGATVVASFQAPVLFVIAQDLRKMRVLADVDEADVGKLKEGMLADATVDAFPGETFHGKVSQVRYSPNNVSGVVTYSAIVDVDNPEEKLRPGMTATVTIKTQEDPKVSRIPNAALRYKPTPPSGPDGKPIPQPPEAPLEKGKGRVYVVTDAKLGDEKAEARVIDVGVTDGLFTVVKGGVDKSAKIVTDENDVDDKKKKGKLF